MEQYSHVFDGVRVLDLTRMLAGPVATRAMAEMGAEVIKIEPLGGDHSRQFPYKRDGRSAYFVQQNRGKKGLCIDLKAPEGRDLVMKLLPHVDVLFENFTPGVIGRMGLSYAVVSEINPRIVMCSLSAFGQEGPLADKPGYDYVAQAYSGVTSMIGDPDGCPSLVGLGLGDVMTGMQCLTGIACALFHRERTGRGQYVNVSLLETYFHCHEVNVEIHTASGGEIKPTRTGSQHPQVAPVGIFKAKDGYVFIVAASDHQWPQFCRAIGRPELATDPRYHATAQRFENRKDVLAIINEWLTTRTVTEAVESLEAERVPVAPVYTIEQAVRHPHMQEQGIAQTVRDRALGEYQVPRMPLRFSDFPEPLELEAPFLGEHNAEVLAEYCDCGPQEYRRLMDRGVLAEKHV